MPSKKKSRSGKSKREGTSSRGGRLAFADKDKKEHQGRKYKHRPPKGWKQVSLLLDPLTKQWWEDPDVVVAFNLPRISGCLERLMGTNVVRLTDRNYMKLLRERIDAEYIHQLQLRIRHREQVEVERERVLIIEGRTDNIPDELASDPIFMVNRLANIEIEKQRSKLKTNRERNAERLKIQGRKWERERLRHEEEEILRQEKLAAVLKQRRDLENQYYKEDAERGMDLLRIFDEDWRECELKLKKFLEDERAKMKERSLRVSLPFTSDPKDIQSIVLARQRFRQMELRMRLELERRAEKAEHDAAIARIRAKRAADALLEVPEEKMELDELQGLFGIRGTEDDSEVSIESEEIHHEGSTLSVSRLRYQSMLDADLEDDVNKGLLINREQYQHLRYEDPKIVALHEAKDIKELYQLAEDIILGDRREDLEEEAVEEEDEVDDGKGSEGSNA